MPAAAVALDSRIEVFPPDVWDAHAAVIEGHEDWPEILTGWDVTVVVASADEDALVERLGGAGWTTVYADADGTILLAPTRTAS
jgi:hypothetical protein